MMDEYSELETSLEVLYGCDIPLKIVRGSDINGCAPKNATMTVLSPQLYEDVDIFNKCAQKIAADYSHSVLLKDMIVLPDHPIIFLMRPDDVLDIKTRAKESEPRIFSVNSFFTDDQKQFVLKLFSSENHVKLTVWFDPLGYDVNNSITGEELGHYRGGIFPDAVPALKSIYSFVCDKPFEETQTYLVCQDFLRENRMVYYKYHKLV